MSSDLIERDRKHLWHPFTPAAVWEAEEALVIERGEGNYLIDTDGRRYFDGVSSLWTMVHGHNHPKLNAAIVDQLGRIAHTTLLGLASPPSIELAERLVGLAPANLTRVFYSDSGSTAVEIALKQSFQYWRLQGRAEKTRFVHLEHAYHGDTIGAVSVGGISTFHETFGPLLAETLCAPAPHPYRHPLDSPEAVRDYAIDGMAQLLAAHSDSIAAVIVEPLVQGAAGMLVHPPGFLAGVARVCREHNVHLILDEVATGFGRTGSLFACEQEDVKPDFLCVAKGITGGYLPLAATLSTEVIYEGFRGGHDQPSTFFHGHTYTGNPLACAVAIASLELFDRGQVIASLPAKIAQLQTSLEELTSHPHVGDVRQRGMMIGIELVADRSGDLPFDPIRRIGAAVCRAAREHGVILRPLGDVVVLMPPLSSTLEELEHLVKAVAMALEDTLS